MDDILRAIKLRTQPGIVDILSGRVVILPLQLWGKHLPPLREHVVKMISQCGIRTFSAFEPKNEFSYTKEKGAGTYFQVDEDCSGYDSGFHEGGFALNSTSSSSSLGCHCAQSGLARQTPWDKESRGRSESRFEANQARPECRFVMSAISFPLRTYQNQGESPLQLQARPKCKLDQIPSRLRFLFQNPNSNATVSSQT